MPCRNIIIILTVLLAGFFLSANFTLKDRILISVLHLVEKKGLESPSRDDLVQGALTGMMAVSPYYPYSAYLSPKSSETYQEELQGIFDGIGITHMVLDQESGELWFTPLYGGPAWDGGLRFGDRIVQINGERLDNLSIDEICTAFRGGESPLIRVTVRPRASVLARCSVPEGEREEEPNPFKEIEILRGSVQQDLVSGYRRNPDGSWSFLLDAHPEIGYIRIDQFTDEVLPLFSEALNRLKEAKIKSLILDLRGNPGGFIEGPLKICSPFLPEGTEIVTTRGREGKIRSVLRAEKGEKLDWHLAVLIDGESASSSEITAGALADSGRAVIIGTRSYGKGTVQDLFVLPCNTGLLRLTDASWHRPNGAPIHRAPNAPDTAPWGITPAPEMTIPLTPFQQTAILLLRDLRADPAISEGDQNLMEQLVLARSRKADLFTERGTAEAEADQAPLDQSAESLLIDPHIEKAVEVLSAEEIKK